MVILETERLLFRDHELEDMDAFCAMEADPEVRRYTGGKPRTRENAEEKFKSVYLPPVKGQMALWATVYKPEGCYIGYCGLYPHFGKPDPIPGEGVLGYILARPYWGLGLATEAARAFVDFGFNVLNLTTIYAVVESGNDASLHVLKKLGMRKVGTEYVGKRALYTYELIHPRFLE